MTTARAPAPAPRADSLRGVVLMLAAMAILPFLDVVAKHLGQQGVPILMIVWARMALGAALTLPFALGIAGRGALWPDRPVFHLMRAGFLIAATFFFFWSLKFLGIAEALAIFFVQPLVVTALSPLVLGEKVGLRRWAAVAVGFAGTLVILRPGLTEIGAGQVLAFASGVSLALYMLVTRRMAGQAHAVVTMFHTSLMGAALTSVAVPFLWQSPDAWVWAQFVLVGLIATAGHLLITRAYDHAEASLLAPLAYTEIVMATVVGWWFFGDLPDGWTFVGVAILIGSALYISARERASARPV
ncbi:MAG: hypothetical protein RIR62_1012 [Pseudomonadota bacterium]|jgi:drug/metabolite transporter (DMT)-like permease